MATMHELTTVLGTQDLYEIVEVLMIDDHNAGVARRIAAERA